MSTRQAIVLGGAGFIGSHLLALLAAEKKYQRIVSVDIKEPQRHIDGVEYIRHNVRNPIPPSLSQGAPFEIFNLAAVHVTPGHEDWEYYYTNVLGAVHTCRFANETNSRQIVFTSSISIYGPTEKPLSEEATPAPTSAYGRSKLAAEKIHQLWQSENSERRLTVVRPAVIYGLGEHGNFTRLARLLANGTFIYPGRTDTIKSCGYVRDLIASMMFMAAQNDGSVTYNFCFEDRYTISQICAAFCAVAGYRKPRFKIPIGVMNLAVLPFEWAQRLGINTGINRERIRKLWFSTNIIPRRLLDSGFRFEYDIVSSLRDWKTSSKTRDFD